MKVWFFTVLMSTQLVATPFETSFQKPCLYETLCSMVMTDLRLRNIDDLELEYQLERQNEELMKYMVKQFRPYYDYDAQVVASVHRMRDFFGAEMLKVHPKLHEKDVFDKKFWHQREGVIGMATLGMIEKLYMSNGFGRLMAQASSDSGCTRHAPAALKTRALGSCQDDNP